MVASCNLIKINNKIYNYCSNSSMTTVINTIPKNFKSPILRKNEMLKSNENPVFCVNTYYSHL